VIVLSSALVFAGLLAEDSSASIPPPTIGFPDTVVTQVLPDGRVAGAGPKWKMIVGSEKATFVPVLGKRAPRNMPVEFGMPSFEVGGQELRGTAGTPKLVGDTASVDHGPFSAVYDFSPGFVEQSFVVDELPARGELTVRIPLFTDLAVDDVPEGLRFAIPGIGAVTYGDSTIIDRAGRRVAAESAVRDGAIEIRVPSSFIAVAEFPIVVDPAITPVFDIDENSNSFNDPDVAWDSVHNLYTVLFERANSLTESDLFVNRVLAGGGVQTIAAVDLTSNNTVEASIANAPINQNYLCVWRKDPDGIFDDVEIRGAIVTTGGGASTSFTISTGSSNESRPDVGGSSTNSTFLVVWEEEPVVGNDGRNIVARTVNAGSKALGPKIDVAFGGLDEIRPRLNKQSVDGKWTVVYEVINSSTDSDIKCALFNGGTMTSTGNAVLVSTTTDDSEPDVTQLENSHFVFAWQRQTQLQPGFDLDIMTRRFQSNAVSYNAVTVASNLSDLDGSDGLDQNDVCVCANGSRVLYAFKQGSGYRYLSANYDNSAPVIVEQNINVNDNLQEGRVRLAAQGHAEGDFDQILAVFTATGGNILGQFFDTNTAGGVTFLPTGCGGALEPKISLTANDNDPLICQQFTLSMSQFSNNGLLVIGTPTSLALCPNQGGCVLGATPTILTPIGNGSITFTLPCDASLLNLQIALCGISILSPVSLATACGPPKFTQFFRTSDTMVIDFQ
jgi:hypothetical protein